MADSVFKQLGNIIGTEITAAKTAVSSTIMGTINSWFGENANGEIELKKHLVPADPTVSLGTIDKPFADVFISESSLYVNGTKVLSENSGTIDISADIDQNIRITTQGAGDIEFYPSGLGVIQLKGSVSIPSSKILLTSDGQPMNIGQGIIVDGNVLGDNITSMDSRISSLETLTTSNDLNLDTVQEIVTFIKDNRADLDSISLDWSAIDNKPTTFTPATHTHDDRYYTETEIGTIASFDAALAAAMA
jgi:hypothetical protein